MNDKKDIAVEILQMTEDVAVEIYLYLGVIA